MTRVPFHAFEAYARWAGIAVDVAPEAQNSDYEAGVARIDGELWHIRTARTTPSKPGAFVAFWRRDPGGETAPFDANDVGARLLVFVQQEGRRGLFRFTGERLLTLGVTTGERAGKRGFRVYPSWCVDLNRQAAATQRAQANAFREF